MKSRIVREVENIRADRTSIDRWQFVRSRIKTMLVGTLTAFGQFAYSSLWGRQQAQFLRQVLANSVPTRNQRVIVSLSTLPERIANLEPTLRSLLEQTRPPDEIVLALPDFSVRQQTRYVVPPYLDKIPRLRILRTGKDWGPATKFIPVVQEELAAGRGQTLIMVVDDDRVYPPDALQTYLHYHEELPDAALCFRGAIISNDFVWFVPKLFRGNHLREPKRVAVITGTASYLIQPGFFDNALWDYSGAPASAFYMDDIWISGCLDRRGVHKYVIPASTMMRSVREQAGTMNLYNVPRGSGRSNTETIKFFRETWNVLSWPLALDYRLGALVPRWLRKRLGRQTKLL